MARRDLDTLPQAVKQAFHPDFVFLIYPDKLQHFPARQWTEKEYRHMLQEQLGANPSYFVWQGMLVAQGTTDLLVLMPKYQHTDTFSKTPHQLD
jgi:hypothetical protein